MRKARISALMPNMAWPPAFTARFWSSTIPASCASTTRWSSSGSGRGCRARASTAKFGWRSPAFGAMLDLNAGLSYVHSRIGGYDAGLISFDNGRVKSLRGRLGARMTWSGHLGPFVDAKLMHEFDGDSRTRVGSGTLFDTFNGRGRGTWARIEGGLAGGPGGGPLLSAWADLGDVRGWGIRAGYRFGGSASPPPPYEPMVAPPPAAGSGSGSADGSPASAAATPGAGRARRTRQLSLRRVGGRPAANRSTVNAGWGSRVRTTRRPDGRQTGIQQVRSRALETWLGRQDSNLRMPIPKTGALPLGDAPAGGPQMLGRAGLYPPIAQLEGGGSENGAPYIDAMTDSPIRDFHAHLYYRPATKSTGPRRSPPRSPAIFPLPVGHFHVAPVGPHPRGSCQLTVPPELFGEVAQWLALNRDGLTVFAHASTGDDRADHTDHVIWFGPSETLDLSDLRLGVGDAAVDEVVIILARAGGSGRRPRKSTGPPIAPRVTSTAVPVRNICSNVSSSSGQISRSLDLDPALAAQGRSPCAG